MNIMISLSASSQIWYHGSDNKYDNYDLTHERKNRSTNVAGMYLTPKRYEAEDFGKYVKAYTLNTKKPFQNRVSTINSSMIDMYVKVMLRDTFHKRDWIVNALMGDFIMSRKLPDVTGEGKQQIIMAGGYDSFIDGRHIAVFNPKKDLNEIKE